jgi:hypothetical protein
MTPSPRTSEQPDPRVTARRHRDALRQRTRRIRRSVAGLALALFAVAFLIVYVQLASGHDPALVTNSERRAAASTAGASSSTSSTLSTGGDASTSGESSTATESTTSSGSGSGETSSESSSSESGESSAGASAVTTSQS